MFESEQERQEKVLQVQNQALSNISLLQLNFNDIFYNKRSFRLKDLAFSVVRKEHSFFEITIDTESFKIKDLVKISQLNNDLFFIDLKKSKIYTMDKEFYNWCILTGCTIESIRNI